MKTIGLLGGMSWESTASYYTAINTAVKVSLGGLHSAKICLYSVDFAEIETLQMAGDWQQAGQMLAQAAKNIAAGGADGLLICTNTMHKVADQIEAAIDIPLLHIADATAKKLLADGVQKVGLLGTRFTMEQDFYKSRLMEKYGIDVLVPTEPERQAVHDIIYTELCLGHINAGSKQRYLEVIAQLQQRGAEAVILGCTEIALLVEQSDTSMPLYDTARIHALAAVEWALAD